MAWLGMDIKLGNVIDKTGLGGTRGKYDDIKSKTFYKTITSIAEKEEKLKNQRHEDVHSFFSEYQFSLVKLSKILKPGKFICLVIGNRTVREVKIPMDIITREILENHDFCHWLTLQRNIPRKRHPQTQKLYVDPRWKEARDVKPKTIDNIRKESILILKKP
jgi:hypothetical protein